MKNLSDFEISTVFANKSYKGLGSISSQTRKEEALRFNTQGYSIDILQLKGFGLKISLNGSGKDNGLSVPHEDPSGVPGNGRFEVEYPKENERFQIRVSKDGKTVLSPYAPGDQLGFHSIGDEFYEMFSTDEKNGFTTISLRIPTEYGIYGLGENFTTFNKRGKTIYTFPSDNYCLNADLVYKGIPFFLSNSGVGIVFPRYEPIKFDFGSSVDGLILITIPTTSFEFYLLFGSPTEIVRSFVSMFDKPQLPPDWSFGLWWSRWAGIGPNSLKEVANYVERFQKEGIPLDVVVIDPQWLVDYVAGVTQACSFDWDHKKFKTDNEVGDYLESKGKKLALWINPYMDSYGTGREKLNSCLLLDRSGKVALVPNQDHNPKKPNRGMVDFSRAECSELYTGLVADLMKRSHARTVISDFGETVPPDATDEFGNQGFMIRNKLGDLYQISAFEGVKKGTGEGMIWGRSGSLRSHNLPIKWGGDSNSTWEGMKTALRGALSASMSGALFTAFDIGGFAGKPDKELFMRWSAAEALFSFFKLQGTTEREPWAYDQDATKSFRELSELRYSFMRYILAEAKKSVEESVPLSRPLVMLFPEDPNVMNIDDEFMLGSSLLVAPILTEDGERRIYLPEGNWIYYYDGKEHLGNSWLVKKEGLNRVPFFIKKGSRITVSEGTANNVEEYLSLPTKVREF